MAGIDLRVRLIQWLARRSGRVFRPDVSVEAMRAGYAEMNARLGLRDRGGVRSDDLAIPVDGTAIGARLYRPDGLAPGGPLLLFFHGGGFVIGDVAAYDGAARFFAREGGLAVLSVDYRLGPEHRFPRAHEDGFAALAFAQRFADELEIDPARIAVGGDSAGGGIAAALSAYAEGRGLTRPAYQFLMYPSVDGTGRFPSRRRFENGILSPATIAWFAERFVPTPAQQAHPLMTALDAPQPERLPPTYLLAAAHDPLVDEGRAYAERLRAAGVPVVYDLRRRLPHGFVNLAGAVPAARRALRDGIRATARALR